MTALLKCSLFLVFCALFLITLAYPKQVEDAFAFQYDDFNELTKTCCPFLHLGKNPFKGASRYFTFGVSLLFLITSWSLFFNCKLLNRLLMSLAMIVGLLLFIPLSVKGFDKNIEKLVLFLGLFGSFMILDGHEEIRCNC